MDVCAIVPICRAVDDRYCIESPPAVDAAGPVGDAQRLSISDGSIRNKVAVDIVAADAGIEVDELLGADGSVIERIEAVLDAHVVYGSSGESCALAPSIDVDHVVIQAAPGPGRVGQHVITQRCRERRIATWKRIRRWGGGKGRLDK